MPNEEYISIEDRRKTFQIRNRMLPIGANFPSDKSDKRCWCGEVEDSQYIYIRKYWTDKVNKRPICPNYIKFKINYKQRQDYKIKHQSEQEKNERKKPCDPTM